MVEVIAVSFVPFVVVVLLVLTSVNIGGVHLICLDNVMGGTTQSSPPEQRSGSVIHRILFPSGFSAVWDWRVHKFLLAYKMPYAIQIGPVPCCAFRGHASLISGLGAV